jgi:energy-coupling factor transport system ATP-binding protein
MEMVRISELAGRHPYDLSPGERKRVAMASVLAMDTPIVVLDEPTTGQDQAGIDLIGQLVEHLKHEGKTVITITHDVDFAAEHFDRVAVMTEGRLVLVGDCREVLSAIELLAQSFVEPPQLMRLAMKLEMKSRPRSVNEFISMWTSELTQLNG